MVVTDTGHFLKANVSEAYSFLQGFVLVERKLGPDFKMPDIDS